MCAESNHCKASTLGIFEIFAWNFSMFFGVQVRKSLKESERSDQFELEKILKCLNVLTTQLGIAKYHRLHTQGAVAFQTRAFFYSPGIFVHIYSLTHIAYKYRCLSSIIALCMSVNLE